jgi:uncharacterized Zn finger protein
VKGGRVSARVTGSRPTPYAVTIALTELPDRAWAKVVLAMAAKAEFAAQLLAGQMPQEIGEVFRAAGTRLFPAERTDLTTTCSCPDWGDPCKHVAATHYVLAEALDRDPFLLFELRGRTKDQVLEALRAARGGEPAGASAGRRPARAGAKGSAAAHAQREIPSVRLGKGELAAYDRPRDALPALRLRFDAPASPGAILQQLGVPGAWSGEGSPTALLAPLVRAAAERARRIALAEPAVEAAAPDVEREPARAPAARAARAPSKNRRKVAPAGRTRSEDEERVLEQLRDGVWRGGAEIIRLTGLSASVVAPIVRRLLGEGKLATMGSRRTQVYGLADD